MRSTTICFALGCLVSCQSETDDGGAGGALGSGGQGTGTVGDCRDAANACPDEFVCRERVGNVWRCVQGDGSGSAPDRDAFDDATYCLVGDATVDPICTPDDAGVESCTCPGGADHDGTGGASGGWDAGTGGWDEVPTDPFVVLSWDEIGLTLTIVEGAADGPYLFGIAETGNGPQGFYGEDCIEGASNGFDLCHSVPADGELRLRHVSDLDALAENRTTLFSEAIAEGLTYVLIRDTESDQGCWTWGHDPAFYRDPPFACGALAPR